MNMKYLTLNEEILLLAIAKLKDQAYPVAIRDEVISMTNKNVVYGALYNSLLHLSKKGFVRSEKGEPTPQKGGKRKIFFSLTERGIEALQNTQKFRQSIWKDVEDLAWGAK